MAAAAFVTDLTEILTQAAEAAGGIAGIYTSFKLLDLARDYYNLYNSQRTFYYNTFQQGLEGPLAAEIYADPKPVLNYAGRVATMYDVATGPFGGKSTDVDGWWRRHRQAYGMRMDADLNKELTLDKQRVRSDWANYMFRFEEVYTDLTSDIRWRKRLALHNIGVKEGTAVTSSLNSSLAEFQNNIQDFGNQLATYGNGIARMTGYKKGLADTADDFNKMDYVPAIPVPDYNYVQLGAAA